MLVVSCRATRVLIESVESFGVDPAALVDGTSLGLDLLRDNGARISWDEFAAVLDNVERIFPEPGKLEQIGRGLGPVPSFTRVNRVGAWLVSPRQAYWFFTSWVGPSMFPAVVPALTEHGDGRLELTLALAPYLRQSTAFFRICAGGIATMPRILGLPDAQVEAFVTPTRARYLIRPPEFPSLWGRVRRAVGALGSAEDALAELERYRLELQESYDALVRSRQDFRALLENMSDSVCVHRDGRVVWGNHAFLRQLGRSRIEEVVGLSILEDITHPEDRAELARTMRLGVAQFADTAPPRRFRVLRPDGTVILIEISSPQIVEFDGAPARLVVGRDITERRRQESAMMVADRMASIGMLAAGVAHEINNPLAYVHANLIVAERELSRGTETPILAETLAAAREGTDRVRAIVRDLKTLSRGDEEHLESVDLRAVVESALTLARKAIEPRARLRLALSEVPTVRGDRARLGQVVLNLLLNAADSIVEATPDSHEICVTTALGDDGDVVLSVRDTGSGIEPDDLRRIFDPFFTTKGPGQGTGLGLSICHRIVTSLGGRIEVESTKGVGTTFRVVLHAAEAEATKTSKPSTRAPEPRRRGRLLVVDDEPRLLSVLATVLSEHHDVVTLPDAQAAFELLLGDSAFDVVLCDLMMAGMTGMDLHDRLGEARPGLERRMLFMTGGTFTARAREFLAQRQQRWLEKPFEMERLLAAVADRVR